MENSIVKLSHSFPVATEKILSLCDKSMYWKSVKKNNANTQI